MTKYEKLKRQRDEAQSQVDRTEGRIKELGRQLKEEFGVSKLSEARDLLEKEEKERDRLRQKADKAYYQFEKQYGDKL